MRGRIGAGVIALVGAALLAALAIPVGPARAANYIYLSVVLSGNGSGAWQTLDGPNGNPDNQIDCRMVNGYVGPQEVCDQQYDLGANDSILIYYRITPAVGSCNFTSGTCQPTFTSSKVVRGDLDDTAAFVHATVPLSISTQGSGTVTSLPAGITCGATCGSQFGYGATVTLTGTPASGWQLLEWSGDCASVMAGQCVVKMNGPRTVASKFAALPSPSPGASLPGASPSPQATTGPKPSATAKVTAPPAAGSSSAPGPSGPPSTGSAAPGTETSGPGGSAGAPSPASPPPATGLASIAPADPIGAASGPDQTGIILAILGAGLFVAIAIGLVGFALMRRGRPIR